MTFTRTEFARSVRAAGLIVIAVVIVGYAVFRSLPYVRGPEILLFQPINGSTISSTTMVVAGRSLRANSLTMNDSLLEIDEAGNFKETLVVFPGVNVISFNATDQFRRSAHAELRVFGTESF